MLKIKDLHVNINEIEILKGLDLNINPGEVHAIMGPNGSGKSTLSKAIAGHPTYSVTSGEMLYDINFEDKDLTELTPDERSKEGVFMAFQYPVEIPGVNNKEFLRTCFNAVCKHHGTEEMDVKKFDKFVKEKCESLGMDPVFLERSVNEGFSGGEKKRNEILQMLILSPKLAILDETDSGLDIDALKAVADGINKFKGKSNAVLLITHYQRLLDYVKPDFVHVLSDGKIIKTGTKDLALELEKKGYDWLK